MTAEAPPAEGRDAVLAALRAGPILATAAAAAIRHLRLNWPADRDALARDEVMAELLVSTPIHPIWLERQMTAVRRSLLLGDCRETDEPLLARLAIQSHLNEYAWAVDAEEAARVAALAGRLETLTPAEVMLLGCYAPLGRLDGCETLLGRGWTGPVATVLDEQVMTVRREAALQARIQTLTPIRTGVSETVRGQYEASPYPRWRRVMPVKPWATIYGWRVPERPAVLIAGCGTGDHAIHSGQSYAADARLLAVDLSRASLGYALRKAREAGLGNIAFCQADLLELRSTGLAFDVIECSGVLHHLADPFEGARAVAGMLRPGGAMKIGVYSATARAGLKAAKAMAARHTPETIRELRQAIMAAPDDDPLRDAARFSDFYATSSCRDLLMHVQEHEMTMADLRRMMAENGLRLLAFQTLASVKAAYRAMYPDDPAATDLANWEAFEQANPTTFRGMYQFWTVKDG